MSLCSERRAGWQRECAVSNLPAAERGYIHASVGLGCVRSKQAWPRSPAVSLSCMCASACCGFAGFLRVGPSACTMVHVMLRACARRKVSSDLLAPGLLAPELSLHATRIARADPTIPVEVRVTAASRACGAPIRAIAIVGFVAIVVIVSQHRRAKREPCNECCDPPTFHNCLLLQAWPERTAQRLRFLRDARPLRGIHRSLELRDMGRQAGEPAQLEERGAYASSGI